MTDKESLGFIQGTLKGLVSEVTQTNTLIRDLSHQQQRDKEDLQKQITENKTEQAKFSVWIKMVAGGFTALFVGLIKKTFF